MSRINLTPEETLVKVLTVMMESWDRCDDEQEANVICEQIFEVAEVFRPQLLEFCNDQVVRIYETMLGNRKIVLTYKEADWHIESHRYS